MTTRWDAARGRSRQLPRKYKPVAPVGDDKLNYLRVWRDQPPTVGDERAGELGDETCACGFRVCCCDGNGLRVTKLECGCYEASARAVMRQLGATTLDEITPTDSFTCGFRTYEQTSSLTWLARCDACKANNENPIVDPKDYGHTEEGLPIVFYRYMGRGQANLYYEWNEPAKQHVPVRVFAGLLSKTELARLKLFKSESVLKATARVEPAGITVEPEQPELRGERITAMDVPIPAKQLAEMAQKVARRAADFVMSDMELRPQKQSSVPSFRDFDAAMSMSRPELARPKHVLMLDSMAHHMRQFEKQRLAIPRTVRMGPHTLELLKPALTATTDYVYTDSGMLRIVVDPSMTGWRLE